ncbi:MAG: hypothetical protein K8S98_11115 [Planctomycetes bacterium]|nr:hypothetical protein [Planctomycetota bacterium]
MNAERVIGRRELALVAALGVTVVVVYALAFLGFFPDPPGTWGHDFSYFLPRLLAGADWRAENGLGAVPWFSPAFGAGLPFYASPGNSYVSVPQALAFVVGPLDAVRWSLYLFVAVGFVSMWSLLRITFKLSAGPALFGAVAFAFNGCFTSRMLIGHLGFHSIMLLPALAHFCLAPLPTSKSARRRRIVRDACLGGVLFAYTFQSGNFYAIPPALLMIAALAVLCVLAGRNLEAVFTRVVGAGVVALALCAAKLVAGLAYLSGFPRTGYALPGARNAWDATRLAFLSVFCDPPFVEARERLVDQPFALERHEWEYGVTWIPLVLIVAGCATWLVRRARGSVREERRTWPLLVLLAVLLAVPIALNVHGETWTPFLKSVPILGSSSSLVRWFVAFVPLAIVAAALACERLPLGRHVATVALVAGLATVLVSLSADRFHYRAGGYSPAPIAEAWNELDATGRARAITSVVDTEVEGDPNALAFARDDALVRGESQRRPYEPMFGYFLEWMPKSAVVAGPALAESGGELNFQHPFAFVYPRELGREPGARFRADERAQLERFLAYGPLDVPWPARQRIANALNVAALFAVAALLAATFLGARRDAR